MAVNPKIIMMVVDTLSTEKGRNIALKIVMVILGLIMMIFTVFAGIISGLLDVVETADLQDHWQYIKSNLSDIFRGMETEIDDAVRAEVYDFMPDFSINLSKAAINSEFDGSSLILYDSEEIESAKAVMQQYAEELRSIGTESEFQQYISVFDDTDISFSDITDVHFREDANLDKISEYKDGVKRFLYTRAMETMPKYEYLYEETVTEDKRPCTVQTLNVTDSTGREQTVEYTCIGGGTIYLPRFIALYNVRQMREYLMSTQNESQATESLDAQLSEAVGNIPETAEEAEEYIQSAWSGIIDGHGALKLNIFEVSNLTALMENSVYDGSVTITTERADNKLSITLESPAEDTWVEIFGIDESLTQYVEEAQGAVELALRDADIPESEWSLNLDGMVQAALFVYFEGFFELPVDRSEIAAGTNGIVNQIGETSSIHKYNYGGVQHDLPEDGVTLWLENGGAPVYANLLNCGDCIQYAYIYDVWDMENGGHIASADVTSKVLNYSTVTIAYVIDTDQFEKDYGFPFPAINGVTSNGTITLFVEYSCLSSLDGISEEHDIGKDLFDISDGSIRIGYSHTGRTDTSRDFITGTNTYYHSFPVGEETPHVTIKTSFMSGEVSQPQYSAPHYYRGLSAADLGVEVNPRLWFKGFRSNVDDELFRTIAAVEI